MINIDKELDRYLSLLRNKIRESGFIQMEIQERLGWGRSYISQLLTKQKALRLEQVLLILKVIGVEPREFFLELYVPGTGAGHSGRLASGGSPSQQSGFSWSSSATPPIKVPPESTSRVYSRPVGLSSRPWTSISPAIRPSSGLVAVSEATAQSQIAVGDHASLDSRRQ